MNILNSTGQFAGSCDHQGIMLDIGCGMARRKGCIGIDITPTPQTDHVRDFEHQGLPFCDKSIERIYAHNVLEHVGSGFEFLMRECWRVLKDEGVMDVLVPKAGTTPFWKDPTHKRWFIKETFDYFTDYKPKYYEYLKDTPWQILERKEDNDLIYVLMTPKRV